MGFPYADVLGHEGIYMADLSLFVNPGPSILTGSLHGFVNGKNIRFLLLLGLLRQAADLYRSGSKKAGG